MGTEYIISIKVQGSESASGPLGAVGGALGRIAEFVSAGVIFRGLEQIGQGLESAAGAGWGAATAFETVMSRIKGLTTTPAADLAKMSADVIGLSKGMNQSATELGEAEYFIASSGFAGKQATDILTASARAASAGLGDTKTIADAVTSALNAYKLKAGDAARITDVLTRAVVEGKGEPAEFAGALGRVLPIAAAAGVNFEQVAASMATMTRTGMSADEAATSLRGILGALLAPGKQAKDALESMGLSADKMRQMIGEKGLMATLKTLVDMAGNQIPKVSDKAAKAMQDAAFKSSEAFTTITQAATEKLAQATEKMSDMQAENDARSKDRQSKLSDDLASISENLNDRLAELLDNHKERQADFAAKSKDMQAKLNDDLAGLAMNLNDRLAELLDNHKERSANILAQISDLNQSYTESQADRKEQLEDSAADRKERKTEQRESILQRIKDATTDKEKIRLEVELVDFDKQAAREEEKQAKKDKRDQERLEEAHQKQLKALQVRIKSEDDEYAKQQAKLKAETVKREAVVKEQYDRQVAIAKVALDKEVEEYNKQGEKLKAEATKREAQLREQSDREAAIAKRGYDNQVESAREAMSKINTDRVGALAKAEADFGSANVKIAGKFSPEELGLKSGDFIETLAAIIPNIRALTGVLSTASSQGDTYAQVLASMQNASGSVDTAFAASAGTWEFQFGRFKNVLLAMPIELGEKVLPGLTGILDGITKDISGKTSGWADLVAGWLGPVIGRLQAAAQTGGIQGVMAEIGTLINEGWTLHVQPQLQKWATAFWDWITGKEGAQAQVPSTMSKLLDTIQKWADDPATQVQMASFGETASKGLVKGVQLIVSRSETWIPIFADMGKAIASALPQVALETGGAFGAYFIKGLYESLGLGAQFKGGLGMLMDLKHFLTGGTSTTSTTTTNTTVYGGVQNYGLPTDPGNFLGSLVP
jgi:TP901 family phage tail tape measure protein